MSKLDSLLITIFAFPSMICTKVSKGDVFSDKPSPVSNDIKLTFPVIFLMIVLLTTELGMYSMISTIICDFAFSISELLGFTAVLLLSFPDFSSGEDEQYYDSKRYINLLKGYMIHTSLCTEQLLTLKTNLKIVSPAYI